MPGIEVARWITGYYDVTGYGWVITQDHLWDAEYDYASWNVTGVMGPRDISPEITMLLNNGEGVPFKMYDDDGELYYSGRIIVPKAEKDGELLFRPLSDFGTPNAGATEIRYQNAEGKWETL